MGSGGRANSQDLVRMLLCARIACALDSKRAKALMEDGAAPEAATALRPGEAAHASSLPSIQKRSPRLNHQSAAVGGFLPAGACFVYLS